MTVERLRILIVDDSAEDARIIQQLLGRYGAASTELLYADSTMACLERLQEEGADLVLLDYSMPGEDGLTFLRRLAGVVRLPPVVLLTGQGDERLAVQAIRSGAFDYVPKGEMTSERLGRVLEDAVATFQREEELSHLDDQIMIALAAAAEGRDPTTGGHLQRISRCAALLGHELGLDDCEIDVLRYGAMLHDIGKLAVDPRILRKPGPLNGDEWEEMQQHVIVGERICTCLWCSRQVAPIIRHHHERWDGRGYLDGLAGDEIPLLARIVSVVDAFDAMATDRPYRKALRPAAILRELHEGRGTQWDPDITDVFIELVARDALDPALTGRGERRKAA